MVEEVIWSENAIQDRLQILDYWLQRTGNLKYSNYLNNEFENAVEILKLLPQIGRLHKKTNTRFIVKEYYLIFYELKINQVCILSIFDGRRNPNNLKRT
jgi:toxin YoeB